MAEEIRETFHSREVVFMVDYDKMCATERSTFFEAYAYDRRSELYHLVDREKSESIRDKLKDDN